MSSISSGDSVLVGVEDNPEFRDYKGASAPPHGGSKPYSNPLFGGIEMSGEILRIQRRIVIRIRGQIVIRMT